MCFQWISCSIRTLHSCVSTIFRRSGKVWNYKIESGNEKNSTMIPEIKKILHPTDRSKSSNHAFNYAARLANRFDATITVFHVLDDTSPRSDSLVANLIGEKKWQDVLDRNKAEILENIRLDLVSFCERTRTEMSACPFLVERIVVKLGNPVDEIMREVGSSNYDMVIMGARGQGVLAGAVMGSVSRRIVRRSETPVLVVRLPGEN